MGGHLSRPPVARRLERCTRFLGGPRRRNLLHLAPDGVWLAVVSPRRWWALTPPFHPYRRRLRRGVRRRRSPFCATFRRLSPPGISPASCPVVSGLSSDGLEKPERSARGHPACTANCSGGVPRPRGPAEPPLLLRSHDLVGDVVAVLLGIEDPPVALPFPGMRDLRPQDPVAVGSPSDTWIPVISLSPSFLPSPVGAPPASIVADGSRPSASQRSGTFAGFD